MSNKAYHAEYNRLRYHRVRGEVVAELGGKCVVCGTTENLEIDHVDPNDKAFDLSKVITYPKSKLVGELSKCQLLCQEHHIDKTIAERGHSRWKHGTLSGYRYCKCDLCKAAKAKYSREQKRKLKCRCG